MLLETEGKARKLSDAMIDALQLCSDAVVPVYGINKSVAVALLLRGMIALDKSNQHPSYEPLILDYSSSQACSVNFVERQSRVNMLDPITGRDISKLCWDGVHQKTNAALIFDHYSCHESDCGCLCHPRNQVESVPVVPGFQDYCTYCLGLKEVCANSTTYIPCPKCCTSSSQKEAV